MEIKKKLIVFMFLTMISAINSLIPLRDCEVDISGDYKYIQIMVSSNKNKYVNKIIVRGGNEWHHHPQIFREFLAQIKDDDPQLLKDYNFQPIGGGFIRITSNHVELYGKSVTYGKCNHVLSSQLLKDCFPSDYKIEYNPHI